MLFNQGTMLNLKLGHMEVYIKFLQYSEYVIYNRPMGTELVVRAGPSKILVWVGKGLGCDGSRVRPPFF